MVIANKIYCFGGMARSKFYNDLHILDLEKGCWITPKIKKRNLPTSYKVSNVGNSE